MKGITLFTAICMLTYFLNFLLLFVWLSNNESSSDSDYYTFVFYPLNTLRWFSIALFFISLYRKQK